MKIDAHQHFWALERDDYGWLTPDLEPLYKNFAPADMEPLLQAQGIEGTVLVQAAPTLAETHYMLELASANSFVKGVVGWVDFDNTTAPDTVTQLAAIPKLVGLRPMIHDIADDNWMLGQQLTPVLEAMAAHDLVFDALTFPKHLDNLKKLIQRHPDLKIVIDHGSKPAIESGQFENWASNMADIAANSSAAVKLSGLVTEAGPNWSVQSLKPYVDHLFEHFSAERIIWGSDWPVCILASSYERWCEATFSLISHLSTAEQTAVLGENAVRVYGLQA